MEQPPEHSSRRQKTATMFSSCPHMTLAEQPDAVTPLCCTFMIRQARQLMHQLDELSSVAVHVLHLPCTAAGAVMLKKGPPSIATNTNTLALAPSPSPACRLWLPSTLCPPRHRQGGQPAGPCAAGAGGGAGPGQVQHLECAGARGPVPDTGEEEGGGLTVDWELLLIVCSSA